MKKQYEINTVEENNLPNKLDLVLLQKVLLNIRNTVLSFIILTRKVPANSIIIIIIIIIIIF